MFQGYQFWTRADENGNFLIKNVMPGTYSLFAVVYGTIGDYKHASDITISPGSTIIVKDMVFDAPRNGPTLWEIGIPDRTAAEFFIPDPDPRFKIHPYPRPVEKFESVEIKPLVITMMCCLVSKALNDAFIIMLITGSDNMDCGHVSRIITPRMTWFM